MGKLVLAYGSLLGRNANQFISGKAAQWLTRPGHWPVFKPELPEYVQELLL